MKHILKIWLTDNDDPLIADFDNPAEAETLMREVAIWGLWIDSAVYYPLHRIRKMEIVEDDTEPIQTSGGGSF